MKSSSAYADMTGMLSGVNSLFSQAASEFSLIFIDQIDVKKQIREELEDDDNQLAELAESIKAQGVLQPILLRPISNDRYELVAGERRYRASIMAGLENIPATIREMTDEEAADAQLAENIHRKNLTLLEEAGKLQQDLDALGSVNALLKKINKSNAWLSKRLSLLRLPEQAKRLITEDISADPEVINSVRSIEKTDPVAAKALVNDLKETRGKEDARDKVATVKDQVKPKSERKIRATSTSTRTQDASASVPLIFAYAKNTGATDIDDLPNAGDEIIRVRLRAIYDDLVKSGSGSEPETILASLSVDARTAVVNWLRGYHDAGGESQNLGISVLSGLKSGQFDLAGEGALALLAFLQGKAKFDVSGILGSVRG
ncbi:ParB/RepB/Spo0J family partition protein [Candidatus Methylospira mobilis]|uniref:ParB/RepB/Spo0J family partition protein n=1 Tax=Candidatus Methylospira mobilis TaxID=1808979 RepID=UPI0028EF4BD9|nr:ParB/RepB/Spo0J family partition protein [Candidatus Methylospira mobilis]WNV05838.1 ParB/RepB/Spo0J family partition protein [Candidatus Methylospira mobilis]